MSMAKFVVKPEHIDLIFYLYDKNYDGYLQLAEVKVLLTDSYKNMIVDDEFA